MAQRKTVVVITGCSEGGIGYSLCEAFAVKGCIVYATARRLESMDGLKNHATIHKLELDVTKDERAQAVVHKVIEREGQIDILVNNAGMSNSGPIIDIPMQEIIQTYDTNVFSIIRMAKAVIPHMAKRRRGTIVNIGSIGGEIPVPWSGIYSSTKAAVHSITDVLYMECTPLNINVLLVSPGGVKSNIAKNQAERVGLPPDSLYKDYMDAIIKKLNLSQDTNPMPTSEFAGKVASAALLPRPPRYMTLGTMSTMYKIMSWFPRGWLLRWTWRRMGENLKKKSS